MTSNLIVSLLVLSAATGAFRSAGFAQSTNEPKADAYPIASELYGDPSHYGGKSIVIYGLIVGTYPDYFLLQDVSQHPLKIIRPKFFKAKVGDQVLVAGVYRAAPVPFVRAKSVVRTRVLGGGGCC